MLENVFACMFDVLGKFDCFCVLLVINIRQHDI